MAKASSSPTPLIDRLLGRMAKSPDRDVATWAKAMDRHGERVSSETIDAADRDTRKPRPKLKRRRQAA